jgi:hypothetical protein
MHPPNRPRAAASADLALDHAALDPQEPPPGSGDIDEASVWISRALTGD